MPRIKQNYKPKTVYLPECINILENKIEYNGKKLKKEYLVYLCNMFITRKVYFKLTSMNLHSKILKKTIGNNYLYYISYLMEHNILHKGRKFVVGVFSNEYYIHPNLDEYLEVRYDFSEKFIYKMNDLRMELETEIPDDIKHFIVDSLYTLTIENPEQYNHLDKKVISNINKINNQDLYYNFDSYGRFHTNFTVLKKIVRKNLKMKDKNVVEIDIKNSQPFFLYLLMLREGNIKDFQGFDEDVLSGNMYEKLMERFDECRSKIKVRTYRVLFGRNSTASGKPIKNSAFQDIFAELYPNVFNWIVNYKIEMKSYKALAHNLQRVEANFIFQSVIPNLKDKGTPIITIHDSILFQEEYYDEFCVIFDQLKSDLIHKYQSQHNINNKKTFSIEDEIYNVTTHTSTSTSTSSLFIN